MPSGCARPADQLRIALPGEPPDIALRGRRPAPEQRIEERPLASPTEPWRLGTPRYSCGRVSHEGEVVRIGHVVDRLDLPRHASGALGIEEKAPVVSPAQATGRRDHDAGDLKAGVEDVLVGRALGPEAATDGGRVGRIHADLAVGGQTAETRLTVSAPSDRAKRRKPRARLARLGLRRRDAGRRAARAPARQRPANSRFLIRKKECIASSP